MRWPHLRSGWRVKHPPKAGCLGLRVSNKENVSLKKQVGELNYQISNLVEDVEVARKEVESAGSEIKKRCIANFHLTKAYQSFSAYWRRCTEVVEWIEANLQVVNTSKLSTEFLEEGGEPQTPVKGSQAIEIEDEANEQEANVQEVAFNAIVPFVPPHPPSAFIVLCNFCSPPFF